MLTIKVFKILNLHVKTDRFKGFFDNKKVTT